MALPLNSSPRPEPESADLYSGINDFFSNMSFDKTRDTASVGPLEIAATPEVVHLVTAGANATVALDTTFQIDLLGAKRDDSSSFTVTSSNGAITFRADTEARECLENPGHVRIPRGTLLFVDDAVIQFPDEPNTTRFSGLTVTCPQELVVSLGKSMESSLGLAA